MADCTDLDKPSLRPGWPAEVASGLGLRRLGHKVPEPDQVVGGGGQIGPELVALDPDVTQLATPADHLQPAEDLLHLLTNTLAGGVAEMSDGAAVDPAAALGIDVLGDVGRDLESAAAGDEGAGVVVLIGTEREPALAMPPAQAVEHLEPCLAFGGSCRLGEQDVDREAVSVLHQKVTGEVELGFPAFALTRQPGLHVGAGDVSVVGTLLAVEVDLNIAAAALAWGRPPRVALGLALAAEVGAARLEALERGPGLEQGAVNGEVLVGEQVQLTSLVEHGLEEESADVVLQEPVAVLGEGALVESGVLDVEVHEPLEEEIVLEPLAELALAANRIEGDQEAGLEQVLGRDRGPALLGIHLVEDRAQLRKRRLYKRLHAPNRVVGGDELISGDREEGHLAGGAAAHAASWKTWAVTSGRRVAGSLQPRARVRTRAKLFHQPARRALSAA